MFIYKIVNIVNNKVYIGQTSMKNPKSRWWDHKGKLNRNVHKNLHLQSSWNKYTEEAFKFEIIESCDSREILDSREIYYIDYYNSLDNRFGYNAKTGGHKPRHTLESRKRMSESKQGFKHSEETKQKISKNNARHMLGKTHSEDARRKISLAGIGRVQSEHSKELKRISMIGKKMPPRTIEYGINSSIKMKRKWSDPEFKEKMKLIRKQQMTDELKERIRQIKKKQYELNGPRGHVKDWPDLVSPTGDVYTNIRDLSKFAKEHGIKSGSLRRVAHGERKHHKGWKLANSSA